MVERRAERPECVGSNPTGGTGDLTERQGNGLQPRAHEFESRKRLPGKFMWNERRSCKAEESVRL
jgi:hypothetical protein